MMLEVEIAGETVEGLRCANCKQAEVTAGIMLTYERGVAIPQVAQKCRSCGQIGCDV